MHNISRKQAIQRGLFETKMTAGPAERKARRPALRKRLQHLRAVVAEAETALHRYRRRKRTSRSKGDHQPDRTETKEQANDAPGYSMRRWT